MDKYQVCYLAPQLRAPRGGEMIRHSLKSASVLLCASKSGHSAIFGKKNQALRKGSTTESLGMNPVLEKCAYLVNLEKTMSMKLLDHTISWSQF